MLEKINRCDAANVVGYFVSKIEEDLILIVAWGMFIWASLQHDFEMQQYNKLDSVRYNASPCPTFGNIAPPSADPVGGQWQLYMCDI